MSDRTWSTSEDPDDDTDWAIYLDDERAPATEPTAGAPLLVFVHIQKTAGKTLRHILRRQYAGEGRSVHVPNYFPKPEDHWAAVEELVEHRPTHLDVAHGHMLFVPDRWPSDARFVTILRDPVERTISHYYWLNERRGARSGWASIEEALEQRAIRDNLQVRVLAGSDPSEPVTSTMAEEAIAALDKFTVVGLTERFDESLVLFGRAFGWRTAVYERVNSTSSRAPRAALAAATIERIQEHNRYDLELYDVAARRFDELVRGQPDDFRLEVDIVRTAVARTALDAPWPHQSIVLSTDAVDVGALVVSAEASRLVAEVDRQRILALTRQVASLQSELESNAAEPGRYVEHYVAKALQAATARIEELESAQRSAKQKIAKARKRLVDTGSELVDLASDLSPEHADAADPAPQPPGADEASDGIAATRTKQKRPRDAAADRTPNASREKPPRKKPPRNTSVERKPKSAREKPGREKPPRPKDAALKKKAIGAERSITAVTSTD